MEHLFLSWLSWTLTIIVVFIIIIPIGAFPVSTVKRVGLICHSCVEASKSEDSPIRGVGKRVRYLFILPLGLIGNCWEFECVFGALKNERTRDDSTREQTYVLNVVRFWLTVRCNVIFTLHGLLFWPIIVTPLILQPRMPSIVDHVCGATWCET